jgi:hypothetical protein
MHAVRSHHQRNTQGEDMTKEEAIAAIKLLSALESWAMSQQARLPDYLYESITRSMEVLERILLEETQEKYTPGTPLLDAMTGKEKQ